MIHARVDQAKSSRNAAGLPSEQPIGETASRTRCVVGPACTKYAEEPLIAALYSGKVQPMQPVSVAHPVEEASDG